MTMEKKTKSRLFVLLIFSACALPIAASLFVYYVWQPSKLMNHGELLETKPVPPGSFVDANGKEVSLQADGKWTLLVIDPGACDAACKQRLYEAHQVWLAFDLNHDRLQHVWAVSDATAPDADLLKQFPGMLSVRAAPRLLEFFPQPSVGRIYLIDAQGNQVLRYMPKPNGRLMIKDVARLLLVKKM